MGSAPQKRLLLSTELTHQKTTKRQHKQLRDGGGHFINDRNRCEGPAPHMRTSSEAGGGLWSGGRGSQLLTVSTLRKLVGKPWVCTFRVKCLTSLNPSLPFRQGSLIPRKTARWGVFGRALLTGDAVSSPARHFTNGYIHRKPRQGQRAGRLESQRRLCERRSSASFASEKSAFRGSTHEPPCGGRLVEGGGRGCPSCLSAICHAGPAGSACPLEGRDPPCSGP